MGRTGLDWLGGGKEGREVVGAASRIYCCVITLHSAGSTCQHAAAGDTNAAKAVPLSNKHAHYLSTRLDLNKRSLRLLLASFLLIRTSD